MKLRKNVQSTDILLNAKLYIMNQAFISHSCVLVPLKTSRTQQNNKNYKNNKCKIDRRRSETSCALILFMAYRVNVYPTNN